MSKRRKIDFFEDDFSLFDEDESDEDESDEDDSDESFEEFDREPKEEIHKLLYFDTRNFRRNKIDFDAVIRAAQQNPQSLDTFYVFPQSYDRVLEEEGLLPLHQAILLGAPVHVIEALCTPKAVEEIGMESGILALRCAFECRSPSLLVIDFLLEKHPYAKMGQSNWCGEIPLHSACDYGASLEVLSLVLNKWPGAAREREQELGMTPLHILCNCNASLDEILLLVDKCPEALMLKDNSGRTPFDLVQENRLISEKCKTFVSYAAALFDEGTTDSSPNEIITSFVEVKWWKGIKLLINKHPTLTKTLDLHTNIMADFLSMAGHHCNLKTLWEIIRNEQDLLADV